MDVHEILTRHKTVNTAIESKLAQIADLRRIATHITREINSSSGGAQASDKVGGTAAKIADLESEINRDIDSLVEIKEQIRALCELLRDDTQKAVIERRYLLHEDWEDIADKIGYSSRHVKRLHAKALERLEAALRSAEKLAS